MIKIAIQKSGRLTDETLQLLQDCGIKVRAVGNSLKQLASGFDAEILLLRDDDIPQYVADGVADIGIVGENVVLNKNREVQLVQRLGYGKCRLSIAVPRNENFENINWLNGKKIATSYNKIVQDFLTTNNLTAEIHEISGSVEIAPGIGLADAIVDIVSSGSTLLSNGLKEVATILKSEAVIISGKQLNYDTTVLLDKLLFRINAVLRARTQKYILMNVPNDKIAAVSKALPGISSPSVVPLAKEGWSSIHSVAYEDDFWNTIDQLKALGAEGILVIPIEKIIA
jgi:ATP phosphoribosyltransferase